MLKHITTATALTFALSLALTLALTSDFAAPAFAQMNPASPIGPGSIAAPHLAGPSNYVEWQHASDWRGSKLIGAEVYDSDNADIGKIEDVLIGTSGSIDAMVVDVGHLLGAGAKRVAIPFDAFDIARTAGNVDKVHTTYSRADLTNAPKFAYFRASGAETTGSGTPQPPAKQPGPARK